MDSDAWKDLRWYIATLLRDGKRGGHEDFKILFRIFGKEKIAFIAKEILASSECGKEETNITQLRPETASLPD
jgi:hypothetical protein